MSRLTVPLAKTHRMPGVLITYISSGTPGADPVQRDLESHVSSRIVGICEKHIVRTPHMDKLRPARQCNCAPSEILTRLAKHRLAKHRLAKHSQN